MKMDLGQGGRGGRNSPRGRDRFQEPDLESKASWVTTEGQADRWHPPRRKGEGARFHPYPLLR